MTTGTPAFLCLSAAIAEGYSVKVRYDGETDYAGRDASAAWQAILDCTEPNSSADQPGGCGPHHAT